MASRAGLCCHGQWCKSTNSSIKTYRWFLLPRNKNTQSRCPRFPPDAVPRWNGLWWHSGTWRAPWAASNLWKTENSLGKQGFTHWVPEVRLADVMDPEHQMHVRHWQVWDEARAAWVREGINGELPAGPSTGSPSRQAMSIRRKRSSFKSF